MEKCDLMLVHKYFDVIASKYFKYVENVIVSLPEVNIPVFSLGGTQLFYSNSIRYAFLDCEVRSPFKIIQPETSMPTTRKQKKARKSRGLEMLSDIENLDIMLGENHFNSRKRETKV